MHISVGARWYKLQYMVGKGLAEAVALKNSPKKRGKTTLTCFSVSGYHHWLNSPSVNIACSHGSVDLWIFLATVVEMRTPNLNAMGRCVQA
eukprot:6464507-Amphidinium_carterae.2